MDQELHLAAAIASRIVGSRAKVRRVSGGHVNDIFRVTDSAHQPNLALRLFRHVAYPSLDALLYVDQVLGELGVSRAHIVAYEQGSSDCPFGWMAVAWLDGVRCDIALRQKHASRTALAARLGATLAALHSRCYQSFGALPNGSHRTSRDYLLHALGEAPTPDRLSTRARLDLDTIRERARMLPPMAAVLTHGDFTLTNAMWSNGEVTLIDWDNAAAAPSARDVQRVLQVLGPEAEGAFSVSYGRRPNDRVDGPVHEVLFLADLLRAACADQSAARDLQRVEQQVARTIDALRAIGA